MKRLSPAFLILVLVLVAASVVLGGCGGTMNADKAFFEKVTTAYTNQDAAAAKQLFATDASLHWNWPAVSGEAAETTTGIDAISSLVASGEKGHPTPMGYVFTYVPSSKDLGNLTAAYDGARYIAGPIYVARDLYLLVLEVRDGKVTNQYVEALHQ